MRRKTSAASKAYHAEEKARKVYRKLRLEADINSALKRAREADLESPARVPPASGLETLT